MITFEEAKKAALTRDENYNECQETTDAWYFYTNDGEENIGGTAIGVVVEKKSGRMLMPYEYFLDGNRKFEEVNEPFAIDRD